MLLDATTALYYFYTLVFAASLLALFRGIKTLYKAASVKDDDMMRQAKFILLFAVIAIVCVMVVSFFTTGKLPVK